MAPGDKPHTRLGSGPSPFRELVPEMSLKDGLPELLRMFQGGQSAPKGI